MDHLSSHIGIRVLLNLPILLCLPFNLLSPCSTKEHNAFLAKGTEVWCSLNFAHEQQHGSVPAFARS
jgi:hypothetical protein